MNLAQDRIENGGQIATNEKCHFPHVATLGTHTVLESFFLDVRRPSIDSLQTQ